MRKQHIILSIIIVILIILFIFEPIIPIVIIGILFGVFYLFNVDEILYTSYIISLILLPQYFSISISNSLPILTIPRILIAMIIIKICLVKIDFKRMICIIKECKYTKYFIIYLIINMIIVINNMNSVGINELFAILTEQIFLFYLFNFIVKYKMSINKVLKIICSCMFILAIFGFFEFLTDVNLFNYLNITNRKGLVMSNYIRMGNLRVTGPFGHPLAYGLFLLLFIPVIFITINKGKKIYIITLVFSIINLFLTGSRSSIICFTIQMIIVFIFIKNNKKIKTIIITSNIIMAIFLFSNIFPNNALSNNINDMIYMMSDALFGTNLAEDFGKNEEPYGYRMELLNILKDKRINPLLGEGYGNNPKFYVHSWKWNEYTGITEIKSIDNYYIQKYIECGYLGLIANLIIMYIFIKESFNIYKKQRKFIGIFLTISIIGYGINLFMVDDIGTIKFLWMIYGMIYYFKYLDKKVLSY